MSIENNILQLNGCIQMKRGTAANLASSDYVPADGEFIVETDTNKIKIGNGVDRISNLEYVGGNGGGSSSSGGNNYVNLLTLNAANYTPILELSEKNIEVSRTGKIRDIFLRTTSDGLISVSSSNGNVATATVNGSMIKINSIGVGEAVITVTVEATENFFAVKDTINVTVRNGVRYGYRIKKQESDPYKRVEYLYDAVGKTPAHMDFEKEEFNYGDWGNVWFITDNKPCMLKNDGTVDYYLNPNDYTKKEDGTTSDVADTSYDGNAMAQIPLCWVYRYEDLDYEYEIVSNIQWDENYRAYAHTRADGSIADYFYWGMFGGSGNAAKIRSLSGQSLTKYLTVFQGIAACKANGCKWYIRTWSQKELIRTLLILLGKSTNSQAIFGRGNECDSGESSLLNTGTLQYSGQFFGYNSNNKQIKVFHIEKMWGDQSEYIAGLLTYGGVRVKMTPEGEGYGIDDAIGYENTGIIFSGNSGGSISRVKCSKYGIIPKNMEGSSSTYYCDIMYFADNSIIALARFGGSLATGSYTNGIFRLSFGSPSSSDWDYGYGLSCEQPKE